MQLAGLDIVMSGKHEVVVVVVVEEEEGLHGEDELDPNTCRGRVLAEEVDRDEVVGVLPSRASHMVEVDSLGDSHKEDRNPHGRDIPLVLPGNHVLGVDSLLLLLWMVSRPLLLDRNGRLWEDMDHVSSLNREGRDPSASLHVPCDIQCLTPLDESCLSFLQRFALCCPSRMHLLVL